MMRTSECSFVSMYRLKVTSVTSLEMETQVIRLTLKAVMTSVFLTL